MKLDRRILSHLFIGADIDLRYFITVLLYLSIYTCGMQIYNLYMWDANKMFSFFKFYVVYLFRKKARVSSIGKRFLFPKVTTHTRLLIPKVPKVVITLR